MSRLSIFLGCLVAVFITSIASACYQPQPPCTGAYTLQTWTFAKLTNPCNILPKPYCNKYGTPKAELSTTQDPPDYFGWLEVVDGRPGVWTGDPLHIKLTIPNQPIPNAYKEIHLEMEFQSMLECVKVTPSPVCGSTVEETFREISLLDSQWKKLTIEWRIEPNPNEETICISITGTGGMLDRIKVETCCIPEPATIMLLSLGTLAFLTKRRK